MQYSDSTFNLDLGKYNDPIILYYDLVKEEIQETIEMIKISRSEVINAQTIPAGSLKANYFVGISTQAQYADFAEKYSSDK